MSINNKRLNFIATLVNDQIVYDIGSDHGYLPLNLIKDEVVKQVFICEKNIQPLDNARLNFRRHDLYNNDYFILSDGFKDLQLLNYATCIIAGMGGNLIADIIGGGLDKLNQTHTLILQPNNNASNLRRYLVANNFKLVSEHLVLENDIISEIIVAKLSDKAVSVSEDELIFGVYNQVYDELFKQLYQTKLNHLQKVYDKVKNSNNENKKITDEIDLINKKLGEIWS